METLPSPIGNNGNHSICTLYFKKNVNSLCRNKVFKQTAESVNDVVSFLCPDKQKLFNTYNVCVLCVSKKYFSELYKFSCLMLHFVPLPPVYFSPHIDDVKAAIQIVCYSNLDHAISHVLNYSISSCALYSSLYECLEHTS